MEILAKVFEVLPLEEGTSKNGKQYKSQVLALQLEGMYTRYLALTFKNDNVKKLEGIIPGERVLVTFDVDSQKVGDKYFNNVTAWNLKRFSDTPTPAAPTAPAPAQSPTEQPEQQS